MPDYKKERKAAKRFVDRIIRVDYNRSSRKIWAQAQAENLDLPFGYDYFRRIVIEARRDNLPTMKSGPAPDYDPAFDHRNIDGDASTKAKALIRNEVLREKYQSTRDLIDKIKAARISLQVRQHTIVGWVSNIRRELGRELSRAEARALSESGNDHGPARSNRGRAKVDLYAPPPKPGEIDYTAAKRLAADVLRDAWETAGKRPSSGHKGAVYSGTRAPSFHVRYAQAWLQTPDATAVWCDLLDVDPDELAKLSRQRHGRPTFATQEIQTFREQNRQRIIDAEKERARANG